MKTIREIKEELQAASGTEREKLLEFQKILEHLITQELHMKKEGEDQCRDLDEAIRNRQLARKEAAVTLEKKNRGNKKKGKRHL